MLFIQDYNKFNLDKSANSMIDYYTRLLADVNTDLSELKDYLLNMLDEINSLKTLIGQIKADIQKEVNDAKYVYQQAGMRADNYFNQIQTLLDRTEEEIASVEISTQNIIESIDCSQTSTCSYSAIQDESDSTCTYSPNTTPTNPSSGSDNTDCTYCTYSQTWIDNGNEKSNSCNVCNVNGQFIDLDCNNATDFGTYAGSCTYSIDTDENGTVFHNDDGTYECIYTGQSSDKIPENCAFSCSHNSACLESSIPPGCDYTCTDGGYCNYTSGECNYKTSDASCSQTIDQNDGTCEHTGCVFNSSDCSFGSDPSCQWDSSIGFDYGCSQFDCHDCSNTGGGDCGQSCSQQTCSGGDGGSDGPCYESCCDSFDSNCTQVGGGGSDSGGDDSGGSNVICTYLIKRLFNNDKKLLRESKRNVIIGLRNGLNKAAFKDYYEGLGPEIISYLEKEPDIVLMSYWINKVQPVWKLLRSNEPRAGYEAYVRLLDYFIKKYNIDLNKYPEAYKSISFITNRLEDSVE